MKKMNNGKDFKIKDGNVVENMNILGDFEDNINNNKLNSFSIQDPNKFFRSLSTPRFLGSYHMKEALYNRNTTINNLLKGNLELKYTKSLRSIVFNPLTITLIIAAVLFNFLWLIYTLS
jgi:hypothetical protein